MSHKTKSRGFSSFSRAADDMLVHAQGSSCRHYSPTRGEVSGTLPISTEEFRRAGTRLGTEVPETSPGNLTISQSENRAPTDRTPRDPVPHTVFTSISPKATGAFLSLLSLNCPFSLLGLAINTVLSSLQHRSQDWLRCAYSTQIHIPFSSIDMPLL